MANSESLSYGYLSADDFSFPEKSQGLIEKAVERSMADSAFREALIHEPKATLLSFFEEVIDDEEEYEEVAEAAENFEVGFVEQDRRDLVVVLPDPVDEVSELSEEELEAVAGGANSLQQEEDCWITNTSNGCCTESTGGSLA